MSTPHREDAAERRRNERKEKSPYNQAGRKKMFISRWSPSIRNALSRLWYGESTTGEEPEMNTDGSQDKEVNEVSGDESQNESDSAMNASTMSEDQVLTQLTMPSSRHVRFDFSSFSGHTQPETAGLSTPVRPPPIPYVAPLPPSSIRMQQPDNSDPVTKVNNYLEKVIIPRGGECTEVEVLGMSLLLQSAVRGSPSSSASSPVGWSSLTDTFSAFNAQAHLKPMFTTPNTDIGAILAASTISRTPSPQRASPSRTLKQNPNGPISFEGGGSARPRYRSPSYGTPSSRNGHSPHRDFAKRPLSDNANEQPSPTDGKRRRVGEDKETSVAEPSAPVSQPNGRGNDTVDSTPSNGVASSSRSTAPPMSAPSTRLAFSRFTAATPARPSPLRQSVRADSSSPGSPSGSASSSMTTGTQPTTSSGFIAAAIRTVTPKKPPPSELESSPEDAFRNPYQQSSRHTRKVATKPLRPPPKPSHQPEASTKESSPPAKKQSALEYIQASAPTIHVQTGLKRSHEEAKAKGIASSSNIRPVKATVIEVSDEDDDDRPQKKQKQEVDTGKGKEKVKAPQEVITIDDDEDVVIQAKEPIRPSEVIEPDAEPEKGRVQEKVFPKRFPSAPKEPSPLRQSFQPDAAPFSFENQRPETTKPIRGTQTGVPGARTTMITTPTAPSLSASSPTTGGTFSFGTSNLNPPSVPHHINPPSASTSATSFAIPAFNAPSMPASAAPSFSTTKATIVPPSSNASMDEIMDYGKRVAAAIPIPELPGFDFTRRPRLSPPELAPARQTVLSVPMAELPSFKFDRPSSTSSVSTATQPSISVFSVTSIPQPAIDIVPKIEVKGFDWSAAGLKKPSSQGWMCPTCFVDNQDEATKCMSCTNERPSTITTAHLNPFLNGASIKRQDTVPKAEVKGFDWSAAGLTKPVVQGWTCGTCFLENKGDVTECIVCNAMMPGSTSTSASTNASSAIAKPNDSSAPKSEVKAFDWSAAGLNKPVSKGWKCTGCFLENKNDVTQCVVCTKEKPGTIATASTTSGTSTETPSSDAKPKAAFASEIGKGTSAKVPPSAGTIPTFGNFSFKPADSAAFPSALNPFVTTAGTSSSPFGATVPMFGSSGFSFGFKPPVETSGEDSKVEDTNSPKLSKKEDGDVK